MKTTLLFSRILFTTVALVFTATLAEARSYGVSAESYGRGTKYTTERGGTAYVGPRGVAAEGANGRYGTATARGGVAGGPNGVAVSGRYGAAAVGENGVAVAGRYGAAYAGRSGSAAVVRPGATVVAPLPVGYIRTVPVGCTTVVYGGYNCLFVGGIYYRPVIYGGESVYVVVR